LCPDLDDVSTPTLHQSSRVSVPGKVVTRGGNHVANVCHNQPTGHLDHPVMGQLTSCLPDGAEVDGQGEDDQAQEQGHAGGCTGEDGVLDKYGVVAAGSEKDVTVGDEADNSPNTSDDDEDSFALNHNIQSGKNPD